MSWPKAQIVRDLTELRKFKSTPGKNTYVVGGAGLVGDIAVPDLNASIRNCLVPTQFSREKLYLAGSFSDIKKWKYKHFIRKIRC